MNAVIDETEEQKATRIRALRARVALEEAPHAVEHLRELLAPSDGRTERGIDIRYERTPLLTSVADDADETYKLLVDWTLSWAGLLQVPSPTTAIVAHRNFQDSHASQGFADAEVRGFKAGTTSQGARALTQLLTTWLLVHSDQIRTHELADVYHDEISAQVWRVRAGHGLLPAQPVTVGLFGTDGEPRKCLYGHAEVKALFFGEPMASAEARGEFDFEQAEYRPESPIPDEKRDPTARAGRQILDAVKGIRVECAYCGWSARPKVSEIAGWLS
jgi:hypothetical protein